MTRMDYDAADGREIFLSFEDERNTLFGLLRLRIQSGPFPALYSVEDGKSAVVRELHIFGPEVPLSGKANGAAQHKGLGKALFREAERIALEEFEVEQMIVLSGTGAKEYYRTVFDYSSKGDYMVKTLRPQG